MIYAYACKMKEEIEGILDGIEISGRVNLDKMSKALSNKLDGVLEVVIPESFDGYVLIKMNKELKRYPDSIYGIDYNYQPIRLSADQWNHLKSYKLTNEKSYELGDKIKVTKGDLISSPGVVKEINEDDLVCSYEFRTCKMTYKIKKDHVRHWDPMSDDSVYLDEIKKIKGSDHGNLDWKDCREGPLAKRVALDNVIEYPDQGIFAISVTLNGYKMQFKGFTCKEIAEETLSTLNKLSESELGILDSDDRWITRNKIKEWLESYRVISEPLCYISEEP